LFADAINQQLAQKLPGGLSFARVVEADLIVTVAELGQDLFKELKLLEPCGMGNPVPQLLIKNCWFRNAWHQNQKDLRGNKIRYIKTDFEIADDSSEKGFPGIWWGHYKDEIPPEDRRCDAVVELDFNAYKKRYEVRLIALRPSSQEVPRAGDDRLDWILDWRRGSRRRFAIAHCGEGMSYQLGKFTSGVSASFSSKGEISDRLLSSPIHSSKRDFADSHRYC
jgi:single-stranded-DNA-specific exonuclease